MTTNSDQQIVAAYAALSNYFGIHSALVEKNPQVTEAFTALLDYIGERFKYQVFITGELRELLEPLLLDGTLCHGAYPNVFIDTKIGQVYLITISYNGPKDLDFFHAYVHPVEAKRVFAV